MKYNGNTQEMLIINTALHFFDSKLMEAAKAIDRGDIKIDEMDPKLRQELEDISNCFTMTNRETGEEKDTSEINTEFIAYLGTNVCELGNELNATLYKSLSSVDGKEPLQDTFLQLVTEGDNE